MIQKLQDEVNLLKKRFLWRTPQIMHFLEIEREDFQYNCSYESQNGLTILENLSVFKGSFYFKGDSLEILYAGYWHWDIELPDDMNIPPYGPPSAELSSRAGKTFTQYVWPEQGFSIATNHHEIGFIEVFHPTTLEDYKAKFWTDPEWHKKYNK